MAKRVGVLEADQALSDSPVRYVKKCVAEILIRRLEARRIATHLIQMIETRLAQAIQAVNGFWDGPLGIGNALPFSKPTDPCTHYSYPVPMAGDVGVWRHLRKRIYVSVRSGAQVIATEA